MDDEGGNFIKASGAFLLSLGLITLIRNRRRTKGALHNDEFSNPRVQGLNRLKAHSLLCGFNSEDEARHLVAQPRCSPYSMDMNGAWQFKLFDTLDDGLEFIANVDKESDPSSKNNSFNNGNRERASSSRSSVGGDSSHGGSPTAGLHSDSSKNKNISKSRLSELTTVRVPGNWQLQVREYVNM